MPQAASAGASFSLGPSGLRMNDVSARFEREIVELHIEAFAHRREPRRPRSRASSFLSFASFRQRRAYTRWLREIACLAHDVSFRTGKLHHCGFVGGPWPARRSVVVKKGPFRAPCP